MQLVTPEFAKQFSCAAADCPDTCCQGWEIVIDSDTLEYYQQLEGALGETVRSMICLEDEPHFGFSNNGLCALLDESGLCKLQKAYGAQAQCRVCRTYPRFLRQYGALREEGVSLSCPEALRLLLKDTSPVRFVSTTEELPIEPNDIDPALFLALKQCRALAFSLVQDRRYRFDERLYLLVCFAEAVQYCLSGSTYQNIDRVCRRFSSPIGRASALHKKSALQFHFAERYRLISEWTVFFSGLEILSEKWSAALDELGKYCRCVEANSTSRSLRHDFEKACRAQEYEYEHILIVTLFKYWLEAADDGILLPKVQQAVVSVLLLRELNLMQWSKTGSYNTVETAHRIARELEHNEENLEAMRQAFLHMPCFCLQKLKIVI